VTVFGLTRRRRARSAGLSIEGKSSTPRLSAENQSNCASDADQIGIPEGVGPCQVCWCWSAVVVVVMRARAVVGGGGVGCVDAPGLGQVERVARLPRHSFADPVRGGRGAFSASSSWNRSRLASESRRLRFDRAGS
jgi:hypothetical protein